MKLLMDISQYHKEHGNEGYNVVNTPSQPNPVQTQYKYVYDPNSGYSDMRTPSIGSTPLDGIDTALNYLRVEAKFRKSDDTALQFLRDLSAYEPSRWSDKLADKKKFMNDMDKRLLSIIDSTNGLIEGAYRNMSKPDVRVDPAYKAEFDRKASEFRQFVSSFGR